MQREERLRFYRYLVKNKEIKEMRSILLFYSGLQSLKWHSIFTMLCEQGNKYFDQHTYLDQYSTASVLSHPIPWSWTTSNPNMRLYFCLSHLKSYTFLQNKKVKWSWVFISFLTFLPGFHVFVSFFHWLFYIAGFVRILSRKMDNDKVCFL